MIGVILILGLLLGVVLNNGIFGISISIGFWVVGWIVTRPRNSIFHSYNKKLEEKQNKKSSFFKPNNELKYSIYGESSIISLNKKWVTSTRLFNLDISDFQQIRRHIQDISNEGIPFFYYLFFEPENNTLGSDNSQFSGILGIRLTKQIKNLKKDSMGILVSQSRMAASRLKKIILRFKPTCQIRELIDYELMQTFQKIMFAPSSEHIEDNHKSLWIQLDQE